MIILISTARLEPGPKFTLDMLRMVVGPPATIGMTPLVREMVPLKPLILDRLTKTSPVEPWERLRKDGPAVREKSGGGADEIVKDRMAVLTSDPLWAVNVIE